MKVKYSLAFIKTVIKDEDESENGNNEPYFEVMRGLDVIWQLPVKIRICMLAIFIVMLFLIK